MPNNICTVETCENFRSRGDSLFCFADRKNWREVCKLNGIEEIDIPLNETYRLLEVFRNKI
ncbi:hypothetical protein LCGC14_0570110 [marine sediment metagenome]|uniref:Uncharacterized protein n=1 Tax=marine sediment metagenome TaxID=412755 RepID=A0A0F9RPM5_9ZZZZ